MENSIKEDIKIVENYLANSAINETDSNFFKNGGWETVDLEIPKSMKYILSDYKRVLKENEELKQDRNNNYQMIVLAQNEALGYMQGYEDGKKLKRSAVANIVENQQYYIFNKQIEHYKEYIVKLQKENKELKEYISIAPNLDEMTATKYRNIQQDAYIQGRAEEQQKAEQIIYENYISKQIIKDKIEEIKQEKKKYGNCLIEMYEDELVNRDIKILQELLESEEK